MKLISFILISYLIQVSVCAYLDIETETFQTTVSEGLSEGETEEEMAEGVEKETRANMQVVGGGGEVGDEDEDEDSETNGENPNLQNQEDGDEGPESTPQPNPENPAQPNPDQTRVYGMPGVAGPESRPQPEYTPINARDYMPQTCHGSQYMCQKTDQKAQTRCIPQEWRCNGLRDCELNDDENGCTIDQMTRGRTQTKCTHEQYQCHGSGINSIPPQCIERRFVCDGTYHCSYGDDEANCADRNRPSVYPNNRIPQQNNEQSGGRGERPEPRQPDPRDNRDMYRPHTTTSDRTGDRAGDRKSEEYVQRLEWRDRCFRSCLKY